MKKGTQKFTFIKSPEIPILREKLDFFNLSSVKDGRIA